MNISFYVLSENKAQDILGFICQLTQTALNKGNQSLLILSADKSFLATMDEALWSHDATSFIPHQRLVSATQTSDSDDLDSDSNDLDSDADIDDSGSIVEATNLNDSNEPSSTVEPAPVLLASFLPAEFQGIIINTTSRPVNDFISATSNARPTRVLEIIKPDATSKQDGRDKYKHYKALGYELTHFNV